MHKIKARKRRISPIWILPLVALLIGGWLLYRGIQNAGIEIIVEFDTADGIIPGKTRVIYKGIPVGIVKKVEVGDNLEHVNVIIKMDRRTEQGLVQDTQFWIVRPVVSAGRISGLETLISGSYIEVQRGASDIPERHFKGLPDAPAISLDAPGLHLTLITEKLGSIQKGSGIFYKNIEAGSVQDYRIEQDGRIFIDAYIKPEFTSRINSNTRFWNSSGIEVKGSISGFNFRMESLASLIYGGISFASPVQDDTATPIENGYVFKLYDDYDAAKYGIPMTLLLDTAEGLVENVTQVVYRGVNVGTVKKIIVDKSEQRLIRAEILLNPDAKQILRQGTRFWVVRPSFSINRVDNLETLIKGIYITFKAGKGAYTDTFIAQTPPNFTLYPPTGKKFKVVSDDSGSLSLGAPVIFRKLQVGEVTGFELDDTGTKVAADFVIYDRYSKLVHKNSVFWNISGISFKADISGIDIRTDSMKSIFSGGIAFMNPDENKKYIEAESGTVFILYKGFDKAVENVPALGPRGLSLLLHATSLKSINRGTPVLYKRIKVGEVAGLRLNGNGEELIVNVFIQDRYRHLVNSTSKFFNVSGIEISGGISGFHVDTASIETIVAGGISFITPDRGEKVKQNHRFQLYENLEAMKNAMGVPITIHLPGRSNITPGTDIRYMGIKIGKVIEILFDDDMTSVMAKAVLEKEAEKLCRQGTKVWIVSAEVSLDGIRNLGTLVSGDYLELTAGSGDPAYEFTAAMGSAVVDNVSEGLKIILEADGLGSLKKFSPVYYRQVPAGRVIGFEVSPDSNKVWIHINIQPRFAPLIRENTRFWNVSGISVDAGIFSGIQIDTETIEAIIAGGIAFATPGGEELADRVETEYHFYLNKEAEDEWLEWKPGIKLDGFLSNHQD